MSHRPKYSNTYLQKTHIEHDIENNMEATKVPVFTLYYITKLDNKFKQHVPNLLDVTYPWHMYGLNECNVDNLLAVFELNELFTEHVDNIERLFNYLREYERLNEKNVKIQLYFQEIEPILANEKEKLNTAIKILRDNPPS